MTRPYAFAAAIFALLAPLLDCGANQAAQKSAIVISEVRLGHGLDIDGKVPPCLGASRFSTGDPIHLSLWQETSEREGATVRVSIRDVLTSRVVWSEEKASHGSGSYLSFGIGRALPSGAYRAELSVGGVVVSRKSVEIRPFGGR